MVGWSYPMFIADQSYYPMHHWCMVTSELVTIHEHEWLIHLYFAMPMFGLHHLKEASPLFLQDRGRAHGGVQAVSPASFGRALSHHPAVYPGGSGCLRSPGIYFGFQPSCRNFQNMSEFMIFYISDCPLVISCVCLKVTDFQK